MTFWFSKMMQVSVSYTNSNKYHLLDTEHIYIDGVVLNLIRKGIYLGKEITIKEKAKFQDSIFSI